MGTESLFFCYNIMVYLDNINIVISIAATTGD
jgi:hypothetical protein